MFVRPEMDFVLGSVIAHGMAEMKEEVAGDRFMQDLQASDRFLLLDHAVTGAPAGQRKFIKKG